MKGPEDRQLNHPVKEYFRKKLRCPVSRSEFRFSAGKLDVLAYDRENKCFHICEGKRASNAASVGHAIGQLVAYISMIQENGYDFLNRISKEERLELSDFGTFLENKSIEACFYVALPIQNKEILLNGAQLMFSNMGDFGNSIGVFFASERRCELAIEPKPLHIKIRRKFNKKEFLGEVKKRFFSSREGSGLVESLTHFTHLVQIKEHEGNPFLHYEVWLRKKRKADKERMIEVAFHLEFAKAHLKNVTTIKRKVKLQKVLADAQKELKKQGHDFKYEKKWGKQWSRLYTTYKTDSVLLDDKILDDVLILLKILVSMSKPALDKINWGRKQRGLIDKKAEG